VLQSVMISASGAAAIISGQTVKLGQKYGDAVLVKVAESEVVLKDASGVQVLKLYPGVEKRSAAAPAPKAASRRRGP
jgi:MSHA biogenesis protein MshK